MQSRTEGGEGLGYTTFCYDTKKVSNFSQFPSHCPAFSHLQVTKRTWGLFISENWLQLRASERTIQWLSTFMLVKSLDLGCKHFNRWNRVTTPSSCRLGRKSREMRLWLHSSLWPLAVCNQELKVGKAWATLRFVMTLKKLVISPNSQATAQLSVTCKWQKEPGDFSYQRTDCN